MQASAAEEGLRIASVESALAAVERQLGVFDESCPFADLQTAVVQLERQVATLDEQRLGAIGASAQKVLGDVEAALARKAELEGGGGDLELDRKVEELYEFCQRWTSASPVLPSMVSRLRTLQALSHESSSFAPRLEALERQQEDLLQQLSTTSSQVQDLGKELHENMTVASLPLK